MKIEEGTVSAFNAKTHLSQLLASLEKDGKEFIITKHGKPIARLCPIQKSQQAKMTPEEIIEGFRAIRARAKPLDSGETLKDYYRAGREGRDGCLY
jgi:prevent-host-death family protein